MSAALAEFLLARIAEDEGAARYAQTRDDVQPEDWGGWWLGHYQHFSRHDPARVLAECEAKRRIVELHYAVRATDIDWRSCGCCSGTWPCPTLRALALPYADHPDYSEEWKP